MNALRYKIKKSLIGPASLVLATMLGVKIKSNGEKRLLSRSGFTTVCHKNFSFFFLKHFSVLESLCAEKYIDLSILSFDSIFFDIKVDGFIIKATMLEIAEMKSAIEKYNDYYSPKPNDIVLDCGAYNGIYSFLISRQIGETGHIYCFEPNRKSCKNIEENIKRNNITNITAINSAIFSHTGKVSFVENFGASKIVASNNNDKNILEVDTICFKDFVEKYKVKTIDFIKMDVEGAEIQIVNDFFESGLTHKPKFAVASYHFVNGKRTNTVVEKIFKNNHYGYITKHKKHLTTYAWPA